MFTASIQNSILGIRTSNVQMDKYLTQLQTGKRINKASDDAAGLSIADSLRSQYLGLAQGTKNANNAISMLNIADSALGTYKDTLDQMRKKAIQASSSTESLQSRQALQNDINAFMESLKDITRSTSYNGINLLDGSFKNKKFQVGAYAGQIVGISIDDTSISKVGHLKKIYGSTVSAGTTDANLTINGVKVSQATVSSTNKDGANLVRDAINAISDKTGVTATAETTVNGSSVQGGSLANGDLLINGVSIGAVNFEANDDTGALVNAINNVSNKTGVTASLETGKLTLYSEDGNNIHITEGTTGSAAKAGLTVGENYGKLTLRSDKSITIENATSVSGLDNVTSESLTLKDINVSTLDGSQDAIAIIRNAITNIDSIRSTVGAATNQLNRVITVNNVTEQNVKAAESTIRDADLAKAQDELNSWKIKNQAALYAFQMSSEVQQNILNILR